jgi:hypothetical protein
MARDCVPRITRCALHVRAMRRELRVPSYAPRAVLSFGPRRVWGGNERHHFKGWRLQVQWFAGQK